MKNFGLLLIVALVASVMASAYVAAQTIPVQIDWVKINGDTYEDGDSLEFERGEALDIRVKLTADEDVQDVEVEAYISGYRYSQYERDLVSDVTSNFDLRANSSDTVNLDLEIPLKMSVDENYAKLRVRVSNRNDESKEYVYQLDLVGVADSDAIQITDFTVSPSDVIEAGRPLSFKVKVKNYGDDDLDDVYVKVSIPDLGIADDETLDQIDSDETETFEELLLRVPQCAEAGTYTVKAVVEFDEYESTTQTMNIRVVKSDSCTATTPAAAGGRTVVTVPESQNVALGTTGAVYPVMISNLGSTARTYTLSVSGVDSWGTVRMDPSAVVVVQPENVKTVYVYVTARDDAPVGAQIFKLSIDSEEDSKQVVLTANVSEPDTALTNDGLRRGLEIGLIVLVIILILLGLIIGFNKLKGDKEDFDEETQTYY